MVDNNEYAASRETSNPVDQLKNESVIKVNTIFKRIQYFESQIKQIIDHFDTSSQDFQETTDKVNQLRLFIRLKCI